MGYDDFDGFDYEDETPRTPADLRKAQKAAAKRNQELEAQVAKLTSQLAERNLKDVLADKGLRPGLARVIAKEDVDLTDPAAIDAWLNDAANQEDFAFKPKTPEGATDGGAGAGTEGADEQASEYAADLAQFHNAGSGALPVGDATVEQARAQIKGAKTTAEINAALTSARKQLAS